jgi:hypothetical protein
MQQYAGIYINKMQQYAGIYINKMQQYVGIYINKMQQYAGIYLLQNHSTCFGRPSHPSSGVHKTVTAATGTGHSI